MDAGRAGRLRIASKSETLQLLTHGQGCFAHRGEGHAFGGIEINNAVVAILERAEPGRPDVL